MFAFSKELGVPSTIVISLLLIAGALFALAGEMAREAYFLWKFFVAEAIYIVGLVLLLGSFLIFVNTQSVVLSDPIVVSAFFAIVILFFCWRLVHNVHVAQRHVKSISKETTNKQSVPNDTRQTISHPQILSYFYDIILISFFLSLVGTFVIFAYSAWYYVSPGTVSLVSNMATLFITVQGVLLAISVISHAANRTFILFTATTLLLSVITFMVAQMGSPFINIWGIKNGFLIDAVFFALTIVYYVRIATKALTENP